MDKLEKSLQGSLYLLLVQLLTRSQTFIMNLIIYRLCGPSPVGTISVLLEPIHSTILFLSRENIRMTLMRQQTRQLSFAYVPCIVGTVLTIVFQVYLYYSEYPTYLMYGISCYLLAAWIELLTEPCFYWLTSQMMYEKRAKIESISIVTRSICTFVLTMSYYVNHSFDHRISEEWCILSNAIGLVIFSMSLLVNYCYIVFSQTTIIEFKPTKINGHYIDPKSKKLAVTLFGQSALKHFLTEGDKWLLLMLAVRQEQGVYSFATNLGSLVARIVFLPMEETMRIYFSQSSKNQKEILLLFIRFHMLLGCFFVFIGTHFTSTLVYILLGNEWTQTEAAKVLSFYCAYIPFMGINGITEAMLQGCGDHKMMTLQSKWMIVFSIGLVSSTFVFVKIGLGTSSFVCGNMVNLALRIWFSMRFNVHYLETGQQAANASLVKVIDFFKESLPNSLVIIGFLFSSFVCKWSALFATSFQGHIVHVCIGICCCLALLSMIYWKERQAFIAIKSKLKQS